MSDAEQTATLVLRAKEIEDPVQRSWSLSEAWLRQALCDTEATPDQSGGQVSVNVFRQGKQLVVRGKVQLSLTIPCARTLDPAVYELAPELFLVLQQRGSAGDSASPRPKRERRRKRDQDEENDEVLSEVDAAFEWFSGDVVVLDAFVREQILLELPMVPLRSDLRYGDTTAIHPPLESGAADAAAQTPGVDPRLLPLQAIAEKLKKS